jgi:hypothetical protein
MKVPVELEHLIRATADQPSPAPLTACLNLVEARRNLEAEHYLRACALRLDLPGHEPGAAHDAGV